MVDLERIVPLNPGGGAPPLFCVHSSSGSAYSYLELSHLLGPDQPVYGIEAPGFDSDRQPIRSLPALSAEYAQTLREFHPAGDYVLLGWSLGGIIAFDMGQRLSAAGRPVRQVIMIDVSVPRVAELPLEKEIVGRFLHDILASIDAPLAALDRILAERSDEATSEEVFLAAERSDALPADLEPDLLAERYAVFRAHVEASFAFEVTEQYHGPVTHLIASESSSPHMRWDTMATSLTERVVPGSHHSIWRGESLPRLAEEVRAALRRTADRPDHLAPHG